MTHIPTTDQLEISISDGFGVLAGLAWDGVACVVYAFMAACRAKHYLIFCLKPASAFDISVLHIGAQ